MLAINPHPPTRGREKEEKGQRLKTEYKNFTKNINNTNNIKRNNAKYTQPILTFPESGAGALASHQ